MTLIKKFMFATGIECSYLTVENVRGGDEAGHRIVGVVLTRAV